MSDRKDGKSSKINPPTPALPAVSWDFSQMPKPGEVLQSQPNIMIWSFHGRSWSRRGVDTTRGGVVKRRQQFPKG